MDAIEQTRKYAALMHDNAGEQISMSDLGVRLLDNLTEAAARLSDRQHNEDEHAARVQLIAEAVGVIAADEEHIVTLIGRKVAAMRSDDAHPIRVRLHGETIGAFATWTQAAAWLDGPMSEHAEDYKIELLP